MWIHVIQSLIVPMVIIAPFIMYVKIVFSVHQRFPSMVNVIVNHPLLVVETAIAPLACTAVLKIPHVTLVENVKFMVTALTEIAAVAHLEPRPPPQQQQP